MTRAGAAQHRPLDDVQPHAAATEHRDGLAGAHLGGVHRRADAGHHTAPDQASAVERHLLGNLDARRCAHHRALGERRHARHARDVDAVLLEHRLLAGHRAADARVAKMIAAGDAVVALPAVFDPGKHHVVARLQVLHAFADFLDDAGAFVPEHDRRRNGQHHLHDREIGVADAARRDLDHHFVFARGLELQRVDLQRLVEAPHHRGLDHASLHSIPTSLGFARRRDRIFV